MANWSICSIHAELGPRTNNYLEGWHSKVNEHKVDKMAVDEKAVHKLGFFVLKTRLCMQSYFLANSSCTRNGEVSKMAYLVQKYMDHSSL